MTNARSPAIEMLVEAGAWPTGTELRWIADRSVDGTLEATNTDWRGRELSLLFTDDAHVGRINTAWRGKQEPTNVLSFPAADLPVGDGAEMAAPIGDIVLAYETVANEAAAAHLTLADHITHLLVHGLLHLLGHDHGEDAAAEAMERLEAAVLARLGIADPYAGSVTEHHQTPGGNGP